MMGCRGCSAPMFDPAPLSPQAAASRPAPIDPLTAPVTMPTLWDGVMRYPEGHSQPEAIDGFDKTGENTFESVMPPCKHRYEVMSLDKAGLTIVKHTCLHAESGHTNQYVCLAICQGCPLRKGSQE